MSDRREQSHEWWQPGRFDPKRMVFVLEEALDPGRGPDGEYLDLIDIEVPAKYEVCETCEGRGTHVNPSIDSNGLSAEDFAEDPDFAEDYFNGTYDQQCVECHGNRVVPVVDPDRATKEQMQVVEEREQAFYREQAERAAERRMGY